MSCAACSKPSTRIAVSSSGRATTWSRSPPATCISARSPRPAPHEGRTDMVSYSGPELVFVPLGGVGEIGMNFALYGFGPPSAREWIVIDVGVTFPDASLPGVDLVLPDTRFIEEQLQNLRGIVITHAHEDHYGALHELWPKLKAPVWMTPFG